MATLALSVSLFKSYDEALVTIDPSTVFEKYGHIKVVIDSLAVSVKDVPSDGLPYNYDPAFISPNADQVPKFTVLNEPFPGGYGSNKLIIDHGTSKVSGTKTYTKKLMIFAVNNGKLDGNANKRVSNNGSTGSSLNVLLKAVLQKIPEWPCDDDVTGTVTFTMTTNLP